MSTTTDRMQDLGSQASLPATSFFERMAHAISEQADAKVIYGDPIERNGVTIIPVAKVRWGFGGGRGRHGNGAETGSGGGGGVQVSPLGYIEITDAGSEFRPIRGAAAMVPLLLTYGILAGMFVKALKRLLR